jgi:hypothetical protein
MDHCSSKDWRKEVERKTSFLFAIARWNSLHFYSFSRKEGFLCSRWGSSASAKPNTPRISLLPQSACFSARCFVYPPLPHRFGPSVISTRRKIFKTSVYGSYVYTNTGITRTIYRYHTQAAFGSGPMKCIDFVTGLFLVSLSLSLEFDREENNLLLIFLSHSVVQMGTGVCNTCIYFHYRHSFEPSGGGLLSVSLAMEIPVDLVYYVVCDR